MRCGRAIVVLSWLVAGSMCAFSAEPAPQRSAPGRPYPHMKARTKSSISPARRFGPLSVTPPPGVKLPPLARQVLESEDARDLENGKRLRNGVVRDVRITAGDGVRWMVDAATRVWTTDITSQGAEALRLRFSAMNLPAGSRIWIWSIDRPDIFDGPFTGRGPTGTGRFWSTALPGERVRIAYVAPTSSADDEPAFSVDRLAHIYRDLFTTKDRADECHNDSTCYPAWAGIRNAVARLTFIDGDESYFCTGQLIDTITGDFTPYLLTAGSCCSSQETAETTVALWQYQSQVCDGTVPPPAVLHTSSSADLISSSESADFALLLIHGTLPTGTYFGGWTSEPIPWSEPAAAIHHPLGSFKRISFGVRDADLGNFWRINWLDGPTEPGSTGAGIWQDSTGQIFGHFSGGDSACGRETWDDFTKFSAVLDNIGSALIEGEDDESEDNDTCAAATSISDGKLPGQVVKILDEDWYIITVPACAAAQISLTFINAHGDIDAELYEECPAAPVASSTGSDNGETISVAATDEARNVLLRVFLADDTRNTYDLTVTFSGVGSDTALTRYEATSGLPAAIPDGDSTGLLRQQAIADRGTIVDLGLELHLEHTWNGDLTVELSHRDISATLIDRPGRTGSGHGYDNDGFDVVLDDGAVADIETSDSGGPTVTGAFAPSPDPLSRFHGLDQAGTWTLRVVDHEPTDDGALVGWALRVTTPAEPQCRRTDGAANACRILDNTIDLIDLAYFQTCFSEAGPARLGSCCGTFDSDCDDDVDLEDYAVFQYGLTGPTE